MPSRARHPADRDRWRPTVKRVLLGCAALIKATEGKGFVDPRFAQNWDAAADSGLRRGAYHFFTLCASDSEQADNFLATARPDEFALAPAVDLELIGPCKKRPPQREVAAELQTFMHTVEAAWGRPPCSSMPARRSPRSTRSALWPTIPRG
ncbi:GH25 family lysozyme [Paramicrobacterium chengjingii]|uniref:GH25 family lysozyme n=1 Tax=Paramicrobacterium chengjingii TaxID=2769067 RepID=UPI001F15D8ED|nr:GH25 family lysozyme [Microbacterium chengjingii]